MKYQDLKAGMIIEYKGNSLECLQQGTRYVVWEDKPEEFTIYCNEGKGHLLYANSMHEFEIVKSTPEPTTVKRKYLAWRNLYVRQECTVEIEVPAYAANDSYVSDGLASSYIKYNGDKLPWEEKSRGVSQSGQHRTLEEEKKDEDTTNME